jgi:hypothetical protein
MATRLVAIGRVLPRACGDDAAVRDFEDSTLWRISAFDRVKRQTGGSGFMRLDGPTLLPTTLLAELRRLDADPQSSDVLEVVAACMRHREAALLCLELEGLVWPVTLFPNEGVYHSPRPLDDGSIAALVGLRLAAAEPPGVRPPGHWMHERIGQATHYRPLGPLLWTLALHGPRRQLLADIGGHAAYRLVNGSDNERPNAAGALGSAIERLHYGSVSLSEIARWPGMSHERASRLLNALYLRGKLLTTRSHGASRDDPSGGRGLFGWRRSR